MRSVPLNVMDLPSPGIPGKGRGTLGVRRWRPRLLEGRLFACAATCLPRREGDWPVASLREGRGLGMGQGVESSGGVSGLPRVSGSSLSYELLFDRTGGMIVLSDGCVKSKCAVYGGNIPRSPREPSPPWSPSPLGPIRERGKEEQRAHVGALHPRAPSSSVLGRRGMDSGSGAGMTEGVGGWGWGERGECASPRFLAGHRNDREGRGMVEDKRDGLEGCGAPLRSYFEWPQHERPHTSGRDPPIPLLRPFDCSFRVSRPAAGERNPLPLGPPLPQGH